MMMDVEGEKERKTEVDGQCECGQNRRSETSTLEEVGWNIYRPVRMVTCRTGTLAGSWAALSQSTQSCERKSTG